MRINTNNNDETLSKSTVKIFDLFVLSAVLIISMLASVVVGVYYFEKDDVKYYFNSAYTFFNALMHEELQNETYLSQNNGLDTLYLDIPFDSVKSMMDKRKDALHMGILLSSDDDMVNGQASLNQETKFKIDLRLKGDWVDHLTTSKWSYRIHTKGDTQIFGMKKLSIMNPERRHFLYEWGYHQHLIMEDVLTTRYEFINVIENGENKGIYAIEESFNVELLESQEERQGIILRFDEDALWINRANFAEESMTMLADARAQPLFMTTNNEQAEIKVFQSTSIAANPVLQAQAETAIALLQGYINNELPAEQVFDTKKFGYFLAITDYWGANHATFWHNLRYYYNPVTSMIEPIGYDGDSSAYAVNQLAYIFSMETFFDDPALHRAYASALEHITQPEYMTNLRSLLQPGLDKYIPALQQEYGEETIGEPWYFLEYRSTLLRNQINPPFPVLGRYALYPSETEQGISFKIKNLMIFPVTLISYDIQLSDSVVTIEASETENKGDLLNKAGSPEITYVNELTKVYAPQAESYMSVSAELMTQIQTSEELSIFANVQITGLSRIYHVPLQTENRTPDLVSRPVALFEQAKDELSMHSFLTIQNDHTIVIKPGKWDVSGDLIIPQQYELVINPGTTLKFEENAIMLIGNRLLAKGLQNQPITLTAQNENWAGLVVLSAGQSSTIEYTSIENTASINREGWILTGGVTFYESPVSIKNTIFKDHIGEDALNLIHSDYVLDTVFIEGSASDALDTDFSDGVIKNCRFNQIGGDAVDVSGSIVSITDTTMILIADKAVSAGEQSKVSIKNLIIDTANIGIASKDLSVVEIETINLHDINYAGFAAYIKKSVYGPGTINATDVIHTNVENLAIVQNLSEVTLDGITMETNELDVGALYDLGILGN
ncbi:MAG: hypothetical protein JEZ00_16890 [Anaerolineaceae bacterium]|nr:hypothetical protein [Anaerolineaceae bacterium]